MPTLEGGSDDDERTSSGPYAIKPDPSDVLFTRKTLTIQSKKDIDDLQRDHIFHTRCFVNDQVCNVIIDARSYTNLASSVMVEKLGLRTLKHSKPY